MKYLRESRSLWYTVCRYSMMAEHIIILPIVDFVPPSDYLPIIYYYDLIIIDSQI